MSQATLNTFSAAADPELVEGLITTFWGAVGAWAEMITALLSFYACGAVVLNTFFGKVFLPVGKPFGIFK